VKSVRLAAAKRMKPTPLRQVNDRQPSPWRALVVSRCTVMVQLPPVCTTTVLFQPRS